MRISDWSSDVCSSDLIADHFRRRVGSVDRRTEVPASGVALRRIVTLPPAFLADQRHEGDIAEILALEFVLARPPHHPEPLPMPRLAAGDDPPTADRALAAPRQTGSASRGVRACQYL